MSHDAGQDKDQLRAVVAGEVRLFGIDRVAEDSLVDGRKILLAKVALRAVKSRFADDQRGQSATFGWSYQRSARAVRFLAYDALLGRRSASHVE